MSVNEEMTTDTPLTSEMEDHEMKRATMEAEAVDGSAKAEKMLKQQAGLASSSDDEAKEAPSEVGVQSSDDEAESPASTVGLADSAPMEKATPTEMPSTSLFEDERERENLVHQFRFDDDDVSRFGQSLSDRFDIKSRFDSQGVAADAGDVDFVGAAQAGRGAPTEQNMERLNLFGVALSAQEEGELGEE